jgi:hypothetical protein
VPPEAGGLATGGGATGGVGLAEGDTEDPHEARQIKAPAKASTLANFRALALSTIVPTMAAMITIIITDNEANEDNEDINVNDDIVTMGAGGGEVCMPRAALLFQTI